MSRPPGLGHTLDGRTAVTWPEWLCALHRPARIDDEEVPVVAALVPWWAWRWWLTERYGEGTVTHVAQPCADIEDVLWVDHRPAPTDACARRGGGGHNPSACVRDAGDDP